MSKEKDKTIYVISETEVDSCSGVGNIVGYCDTLEEAKTKALELENKMNKDVKQWNDHCMNCICGCEAFKSADCAEAKKALKTVRNSGCPYAKNVRVSEIFYGNVADKSKKRKETSGGFELVCDNQVTLYGDMVYFISECNKLN